MDRSQIQSIVIVTPRFSDNSIGRTYSLWLLCVAAGWATQVISLAPQSDIWEPLRTSAFSEICTSLPRGVGDNDLRIQEILDTASVIVVVKASPESLGLVKSLLQGKSNVLLDVDDPDIEAQTIWLPLRERLGAIRSRRYWELRRCRRLASAFPIMVSNPTLKNMYGGTIIPHVRSDTGPGNPHVSDHPRVAFIGTVKAHKGIEVLRQAVASLDREGFTLDVTAPAPGDAGPQEYWHGQTSLEDGLLLTKSADIIAVPSLAFGYARAQFPVKIVDAQISSRAVVASAVGPIPWALGGAGRTFKPGDIGSLREQLLFLRDPAIRAELGDRARRHALETYTVEAVLPEFLAVVEGLIGVG